MAPSRLSRSLRLMAGAVLILLAPIVGLLPGPGGLLVFAGGLMLVLRSSLRARRLFARTTRRWPRIAALLDRVMRRPSPRRRAARLAR